MDVDVPAWCRWRAGSGTAIVVAPHGGSRADGLRRSASPKVNDLHSAAVAEELAAAIDAGLIVNPSIDRNQLDLNRVSQVRARAPWFLALLEDLLADVIARHGRAELLIVHGWNTVECKCDLGIGRRLADEAEAAAHAAVLTASPAWIAGRLADLRTACAAAGIAAPFGERYPARHPNNVLQLFRRGPAHPAASARLAGWVAAGRVDAVQLELGAPLRWPGAMRHAFTAALRAAWSAAAATPRRSVAARPSPPPEPPRPGAVQAYDAATGIGLTARVDVAGDGAAGSRVLLFRGAREVALFTGETARGGAPVGGPRFVADGDGFRLCFDGHLLACDDGRLYVDLESAFAVSRLLHLRLELRFAPRGDDYGHVRGELDIDGRRVQLDAFGFARPAALARGSDGWQTQLSLHAAFGPDHALRLRHAVPGSTTLHALGTAAPRAVAPLTVTFDGDPHTPQRIAAGPDLLAEPLARMAIRRPLGGGRTARVTFGVARVTHAGVAGFGFYEYARALTA